MIRLFSYRCALVLFLALQTILSVGTANAYISTQSAPVHISRAWVNNKNEASIFFQGKDNGLYRIPSDDPELFEATWDELNDLTMTKATLLGTTGEIFSPPCVAENDWIYFQGANNELYKIKIDGTCLTDLNVQTFSTPAVVHCKNIGNPNLRNGFYIYYQGSNNELYQLRDNGSQPIDLGVQIFSSPCIGTSLLNWTSIYYQGANNKLFRMDIDFNIDVPASTPIYLNNQTLSTPAFEIDLLGVGYIYFQRIDNKLYCVSSDGSNTIFLNRNVYASPCVNGGYVYFQSRNNILVQEGTDGTAPTDLHSHMKSTPCLSTGGNIYFQNTDDRLIGIVAPNAP